MLVALGEKGVKTLDDLGDLASDELIEIVGDRQHGRRDRQRRDHGRAGALVRRRGRTELRRRRPVTTETDQIATRMLRPEDEPEPETGPLRRCVLTRERLPKERMIRFVVGPDRQIVPDLAAKLPGRGIWLSASRDVLETARRARGGLARAFARAARGPCRCPLIFLPCWRWRWSGGSANCLASPDARARPSRVSKRRGSGYGPAGISWFCRRRMAARRSVRAFCPARGSRRSLLASAVRRERVLWTRVRSRLCGARAVAPGKLRVERLG